jgi:hypothetical protein
MFVPALGSIATAGENKIGDGEVNQVTFVAPVRVRTTLLTPGNYAVHPTMEWQDHPIDFRKREEPPGANFPRRVGPTRFLELPSSVYQHRYINIAATGWNGRRLGGEIGARG